MIKLVYWIPNPIGHRLHTAAHSHGLVRSGFVRPRDLMDRQTGELQRDRIETAFTVIDEQIEDGLPLIPDTERWRWIINHDSGIVPSYDWLSRNYALIAYLRQRFLNRLIGTWGLRKGSNDDLNDLYDEWSCGVLSIYRRDGEDDIGWVRRVMGRYEQTAEAGKPIHVDWSPIIWEGFGQERGTARAATDREQDQMMKVLEKMDPRWAGLWMPDRLIRGVDDAFTERAMRRMVERLG